MYKRTVKIVAIVLMSMLICSFISVISFAEEITEERFVTSREVNIVFDRYLNMYTFKSLSDSETVTKSELYNALSDVIEKNFLSGTKVEDKLPPRIVLDLTNYPEELITEDDLFMYLDELEKSYNNKVYIKIDGGLEFWCRLIIIMILFWIICMPAKPEIPNYRSVLENINTSLKSIEERIKTKR